MLLLQNTVQRYAWGQTDGLSALVGSEPSGGAEAELWVGAHPAAPSLVVDDPKGRTLDQVIAGDPSRWLGAELVSRGTTELPFLLKILAIGEPLSLQAHPSAEQAAVGFDRDDAAGIALDAPNRTYRDRSAKPESLVALVDTWAMCGFRSSEEFCALVDRLAVTALEPLSKLATTPEAAALSEAFAWLLHVDPAERAVLSHAVSEAAAALATDDPDDPFTWVRRLAQVYPDDPTILSPLLLNVICLEAGDAVHLPAGNLHAYLSGAGIEIMSASDNVLRGGLTPKHVDVDELLDIVRFEPGLPIPPLRRQIAPGITVFDSGEETFILAVIDSAEAPVEIDPLGPSLLLAVGGEVDLAGPDRGLSIDGGAAVFVAPGEGPIVVSGPGRLWWATVGDGVAC